MSLLIPCLSPAHPSASRLSLPQAFICTYFALKGGSDWAAQDAAWPLPFGTFSKASDSFAVLSRTAKNDSPHLARMHCRVLGKSNENLGKIISVMAKCLSKGKAGKEGLVDEPTWQRMLVLLQQMNSSLPSQVLVWQ